MFRKPRRVARIGREMDNVNWGKQARRAVVLGSTGVAVAGLAAGAGIGLAGWALWRRFGPVAEDLRGKTVLITGGSRGLGFAMAQECVSKGARVAICARDHRELEIAQGQLQANGAEVLAVRCDIIDRDDVLKMVNEVRARFGDIDILINNAGVIQVGPIESQTIVDFQGRWT